MKNNINWLLMLVTERNNGLYSVTVKNDGYVVDNKQKKLFVLKKATMGKLRKLVNEYEPLHLTDRFDSKCLVKCNRDTDGGFVTTDKEFYKKTISIVSNCQYELDCTEVSSHYGEKHRATKIIYCSKDTAEYTIRVM